VPIAEWIAHDNGVNYGGVTAYGNGFSCASRWTPILLAEYAGTYLTKLIYLFIILQI